MLFLALPEGTRKKWQGDWKLQELWTWQLGSPEQRVLRLATPTAGHGLFTVGSAHAVSTVCRQGSFAARCILVEFSDTKTHCAQISYPETGRI